MDLSKVPAVRRTATAWAVSQVLVVALGVFVYFRIRGLTESSFALARRHARELVDLEQSLHVYVEPRLQDPVRSSAALESIANWIYIWGHWPVLIATMAWLLWRHRPEFLRLRDAMMFSGALGMLVFVTFPTAPPRLAGLGYLDTVTKSSEAYRYLQPPAFVNQYAAMPSLHAGWNLLAGVAIFSVSRSVVVRILALLMPVLMCWAVIATANHYVLDVLAGVSMVALGQLVALALEERRTRAESRS
jgi:membrane-associated phospholipid phosphatase